MTANKIFLDKIRDMTGKKCTAAFGNFLFHFDFIDPAIDETEQKFSFFAAAYWKLYKDSIFICSNLDYDYDKHDSSYLDSKLEVIIGRTITQIEVDFPGYDLYLELDGGCKLYFICTINNDYDNYSFFSSKHIFTVNALCELEHECKI